MLRIIETKGPLAFSDQEELTLVMTQGIAPTPHMTVMLAMEPPVIFEETQVFEVPTPTLNFWQRVFNKVKAWLTQVVDYMRGRKQT